MLTQLLWCCGKRGAFILLGERTLFLTPCRLVDTLQMKICFLIIWICWGEWFFPQCCTLSAFPYLLSVSRRPMWKMPFCIVFEGHTVPCKWKKRKKGKAFELCKLPVIYGEICKGKQRNLIQRRIDCKACVYWVNSYSLFREYEGLWLEERRWKSFCKEQFKILA